MDNQFNNTGFPEQDRPSKLHGTTDESGQKEKYMRDAGKIEDYPTQSDVPKMNSDNQTSTPSESTHLTDRSGEEEKEDYINTDERKNDLERRGLE